MKKPIAGIALLCLAAVAHVATAAPATYVYNSPNYTSVVAPYTTAMSISGNFTTASPLPANLSKALIGPGQMNLVTNWSFSDGIQTFTSLNSQPDGVNPGGFVISTDATGAITKFDIQFVSPTGANAIGQSVSWLSVTSHQLAKQGVDCAALGNDKACSSYGTGGAAADGTGGTFTRAPAPTTYTYSGSQYTLVSSPYIAGTGVTGTFTTAAPLAANLANAQIGPGGSNQVIAWSFDDGIRTFTHLNSKLHGNAPGSFAVSTDAKGAISAFKINLETPTNVATVGQQLDFVGLNSGGVAGAAHGFICTVVSGGVCTVSALQATSTAVGTFAAPPTTYYFTSSPFTNATAPYTTAMKVTGQFTTPSPLPPNFFGAIGPVGMNLIQATNWSFSDGVQTLTDANSRLWTGDASWFEVATDATGAIINFKIGVYSPTQPATTTVGQLVNVILLGNPGGQAAAHQVACTAVNNGACKQIDVVQGQNTTSGAFVSGPPPAPPTATIAAATAITGTSATLNGTVNDNGADTSASFDYGSTKSFGANVAAKPASIPAGSGSTAVSAIVSGLSCNTAYYFRLRAGSSAGSMVTGSGLTFTTAACVPLTTATAPSLDLRGLLVLVGLLAFAGAARRRRI